MIRTACLFAAIVFGSNSLPSHAQNKDFREMWKSGGRIMAAAEPEYPPEALAKAITGKVTVEFGLDETGHPTGFTIIDSSPQGVFDNATTGALKNWRMLPKYTAPCSTRSRMRMHFWFEIADGKAKISSSKTIDALSGLTFNTNEDPKSRVTKTGIDAATGEEKFEFIGKMSATRVKEGTFRFPSYPWSARQKGLVGLVVVVAYYGPDGRVERLEFPYYSPDATFRDAVSKSMQETELETIEGKPPGRPITVCRPIVMYPDK